MTNPYFNKVAIIGVGLIGGSLSIVLKEKRAAGKITGVGRSIENLEAAKRLGLIDAFSTDVKEAVLDADLVFVAVPVLSIAKVIKEAVPYFKKGAIVTDGGSVKEAIVDEIEPLMPEGVFFVGGHPIAGTENSGAGAALPGLYVNRKCILTPTADTNKDALAKVKAMWEMAGSEVVMMDAKAHDIILASVSHLPHVIAYSLVNTVADMEEKAGDVLKYSAGGFKDFTRIASSSPEMWRDICVMNKGAMLKTIEAFNKRLDDLKTLIEKTDGKGLLKSFERAKKIRDALKK